MHGGELRGFLEVSTPFTEKKLEHITQALRDGGLLPVGGRGPHAARLSPHHAVAALIALGAPSVAESCAYVERYLRLPLFPPGQTFHGAETFGDALSVVLQDPADDWKIEDVRINTDWPSAAIRAMGYVWEFGNHERARRMGFKPTSVHRELVLPGSMLTQLALDLAHDTEGGWAADHRPRT